MPAARSRGRAERDVAPKPRSDAYVGLLGLSLLALTAAMVFAFLNWDAIKEKPKQVQVTPKGGGLPAGGPAPVVPPAPPAAGPGQPAPAPPGPPGKQPPAAPPGKQPAAPPAAPPAKQ